MTNERLTALHDKYDSDEAFRQELDASSSIDDAIAIAAAHGIVVTEADFATDGTDLTDADLEATVGAGEEDRFIRPRTRQIYCYADLTFFPYC